MRAEFIVLNYDVKKYPFQEVLSTHVFKIKQLHKLHEVYQRQTKKEELKYQDNLGLRKMMQRIPDDSLFYKVYHKWVAKVLAPHYAFQVSYSAHPKMRVHMSGTGCVSDFHRDADVTGRPEQINCYLPFTDVFEGCTVWCESDYGSEDYFPINLKYGQAILWDGGYLKHGTVLNDTGFTRVSCDFRFHCKTPEVVESPWSDILKNRKQIAHNQ